MDSHISQYYVQQSAALSEGMSTVSKMEQNICALAMGQVFLLNLFYDVPVKLVSGALLFIAVAITTPYWQSLAQTFRKRALGHVETSDKIGTR